MPSLHRRRFLERSVLGAGFAALWSGLSCRLEGSPESLLTAGYGPLRPAADESTGLDLMRLPEGFRYVSFGWTGDPMEGGVPTPPLHDGMAVVSQKDGIVTLIRNHEVEVAGPAFGPAGGVYDPRAAGGCTLLKFDSIRGRWLSSRAALGGTVRNCAGGPTPWGTWLTCEETVADEAQGFDNTHGWVFEVSPDGVDERSAVPIRGMGRFVHEAVAVDPASGSVYLTEDRYVCGFYRYVPQTPGRLADGGTLSALQAVGAADLQSGHAVGSVYDVRWIPIENVEEIRSGEPGDTALQGVYVSARRGGASTFARLEGCTFADGRVILTSTNGGAGKCGQVWQYDPVREQLTLLFESPARQILNMPDNMTVSPRGGIVLCEGDKLPKRLQGLTSSGQVFPFALNNSDFRSSKAQASLRTAGKRAEAKDYRADDWCGVTFSFDGRWLFANLQVPGITVAITGPWREGLI